MAIVDRAPRGERRRLKRLIQKSRQAEEVRRATAILGLLQGASVTSVAEQGAAARSTVYRWVGWYQCRGLEGLRVRRRGRRQWTVTESLVEKVRGLLAQTPEALGYLRSTWSSELLAWALLQLHNLSIHASTVRRLLPRLCWGWRRARPTLHRRDPRKAARMAAIEAALARRSPEVEVLYIDEADIDLNPRIGYAWQPRGHQLAVPTPGINRKHYVAGALHATTGRVLWAFHPRKNTDLFIALLDVLRRTYRRARRILLIADNFIIHRSRRALAWLKANPKFNVLFQPAWHPWVNEIEKLWRQMHETVTRNHRCHTLGELLDRVARFLTVAQPFPGAGHGVAQFGSAI
jgi:transposase